VNRRAFSLLEMTTAAAVGALVVLAAMSIFAGLDRSEARLSLRTEQSYELERLHLVAQRAMRTIVTEQIPGPGDPDPPPDRRARLILGPDPDPSLPKLRQPGWLSRQVVVVGADDAPQRFEMVLSRAPISAELPAGTYVPPPADGMRRVETAARRGAFELVPEGRVAPGDRLNTDMTWALRWRPVFAWMGEGGLVEHHPAPLSHAVTLARGLKWVQWRVFYMGEGRAQSQWHTEYEASSVLELPSYMELQVQTTSGLAAEWLFEISWSEGPELVGQPSGAAGGEGGGEGGEGGGEAGEGGGAGETGRGTTRRAPTPRGGRGLPTGGEER
jgi:hypothetical protein